MILDSDSMLADCLAKALPEATCFTIHHLSTPPTQSHPLYAAAPGELAEETYRESHFLSVSIRANNRPLQVYAIEVLIYTTEYLTTLFVSKADSTGYLHLLQNSSEAPSLLRTITTTFLQFLTERRGRTDRRLILSLFARAQNQYLFPGSIENHHKHVLDDRGLIKWWCKVVDPILVPNQHEAGNLAKDGSKAVFESHGYLRVPGCDQYETATFLPREERARDLRERQWRTSDPLLKLGKSPDLPERCLIPRFPDDPKARFVEQLDEELPDYDEQITEGPPSTRNVGRWRSVQNLEQFWEMMSFRQECSSGRLVGFLWAIFQPASLVGGEEAVDEDERSCNPAQVTLPTPEVSQTQRSSALPPQSPIRSSPAPDLPITPSKDTPRPSQQTAAPTPQKTKDADIRSQPEETRFYYWPKHSRGEVILRQKDYARVNNLLVHLDYSTQELASDSTKKWIGSVAERAGIGSWGQEVVGTLPIAAKAVAQAVKENSVMLNTGLIRKKKRHIDDLDGSVEHTADQGNVDVHTLSTNLLRKKVKPSVTPEIAQSNS